MIRFCDCSHPTLTHFQQKLEIDQAVQTVSIVFFKQQMVMLLFRDNCQFLNLIATLRRGTNRGTVQCAQIFILDFILMQKAHFQQFTGSFHTRIVPVQGRLPASLGGKERMGPSREIFPK